MSHSEESDLEDDLKEPDLSNVEHWQDSQNLDTRVFFLGFVDYSGLIALFPESIKESLKNALMDIIDGPLYETDQRDSLIAIEWAKSVLSYEGDERPSQDTIFRDCLAGSIVLRQQSKKHAETKFKFSSRAYGNAAIGYFASQLVATQMRVLLLLENNSDRFNVAARRMADLLLNSLNTSYLPNLMNAKGMLETWDKELGQRIGIRWGDTGIFQKLEIAEGPSVSATPTCLHLIDVLCQENNVYISDPAKLSEYFRLAEVFSDPEQYSLPQRLFVQVALVRIGLQQKKNTAVHAEFEMPELDVRRAVARLLSIENFLNDELQRHDEHPVLYRLLKLADEHLPLRINWFGHQEPEIEVKSLQKFFEGAAMCACCIEQATS